MRRLSLTLFACCLLLPSRAAPQAPTTPKPTLDVFLDCNASGCESSHIRNEIDWVNWVRDRTVADVHLLITSQETGSGGREYRLAYIGGGAFAGDSATLLLLTEQRATDAERRDRLTARIAQGLMRYAVHTAAADVVRIATVDVSGEEEASRAVPSTPADDPWNAWVFSVGLDGSVEGQVQRTDVEGSVELSATRVTRDWKFEFETDGDYNRTRVVVPPDEGETEESTIIAVTRDWGVDAFLTRSVAALWSAGLEMRAGSSTFDNQDLRVRIAPVVEYSFYPYEEFSRRQITLRYSVGANHWNYIEETLYGELSERRWDQQLELDLDFRQPWGSARAGISGAHFLHDRSKYRASIDGGIDIRLIRGLSLDLSAGYTRVHDQLYIEKGRRSPEDVLLELRDLQTSYEFDTRVGLRYTFGSVYNNIVNPRLDRDNW